MKLNLGCGRFPIPGWVNVDKFSPAIDAVYADITQPMPMFEDNSADEFLLSHVIEHIPNTLDLMQECYRIAKPDALMTIRCPHGASDDAWEDQTHVRPYFPGSFLAFSQPYYWRADYGYRGDWQVEEVKLILAPTHYGVDAYKGRHICSPRNTYSEMVATLRAIKPAREPLRELMQTPRIIMEYPHV